MRIIGSLLLIVVLTVSCSRAQSTKCDSSAWTKAQASRIKVLLEQEFALEDLELLDSAITINKAILAICPDFPPTLTTIAGLYGRLGKYNAEVEWARKAITADSTFINAYVNLANAYALLGNSEPARRTFEDAARINPKSPYPSYGLGVLAEGDSRLEDAFQYYQKSIAMDSSFTNGYYNAAMIKARMGEKRAALDYMERLLTITPSDTQVMGIIEHLKKDIEEDKSKPSHKKL